MKKLDDIYYSYTGSIEDPSSKSKEKIELPSNLNTLNNAIDNIINENNKLLSYNNYTPKNKFITISNRILQNKKFIITGIVILVTAILYHYITKKMKVNLNFLSFISNYKAVQIIINFAKGLLKLLVEY